MNLRRTLLAVALALATPAAFAGTLTTQAGAGWTVSIDNPSVKPDDFAGIPVDLTGEALATAIGRVYAARGALGVAVRYDAASRTVHVVEGRPVAVGPYASFWHGGEHLDRSALERMAVNVGNRARADGEHATVSVGAVQADGTVPIETGTEDASNAKRVSGSLGYSNYGSRYSGPDVATANVRIALGDGNTLGANVSHGLSDMSDDSKHGQYDGGGLSFSHAGEYGVTSASVQDSHYRTGGPTRVFDLSGTVLQASLSQTITLNQDWSAYGILGWVKQTQRLGLLGWDDQEKYAFAGIGVRRATEHTNLQIELDQGLGGSRDAQPVELMGVFNPHYTKLTVDGGAWVPLSDEGKDGLKARFNAGGQWMSANAPTNEAFYIGGPLRGRAFLAGSQVGVNGGYASAQLEKPMGSWTPYAGLDTAVAIPKIGPREHATSAFVGTRWQQKPDGGWFFDAGYGHSLGARTEGLKGSRFFIQAGFTF